jgi:hypothetical protein
MRRSKAAKLESPLSHAVLGEAVGKKYMKPRLTGLGLLRVMTKFSVGSDDPHGGPHNEVWLHRNYDYNL